MTRAKASPWMSAREFEAALVELGLTWTAAARRLDISYQHVFRMRRGESEVPRQTADLLRCWQAHGIPPTPVAAAPRSHQGRDS